MRFRFTWKIKRTALKRECFSLFPNDVFGLVFYLFVFFCEPWRYTFNCFIEFSLNFPLQTFFILTFFIMFATMCLCNFFSDGCFQLENGFIIFKKFCLPYFKLKWFVYSWLIYRVVINERYKVKLHCDFILSPGNF